GTGYSSLSHLMHFPVDYLKVDKSFVMEMAQRQDRADVVKTIKAMADSLSIKAIAEGVESIEQLELLQALGYEYGQGFLFTKPMAADELAEYLRTHRA
ncbi:MAG: EAL domain-containing protein, partial [Pseudomonadota bacterium]